MNRLPISLRALVTIGLVVLLGAGGYFGLLAPKLREVGALKAQLIREVGAARTPPPLLSVSPITQSERELWGEMERRFRGRYPAEAELPKALGLVASLARSSGMEISSLEIQAPQTGPSLFRPPPEFGMNPSTIKLAVRHRYRDLVEFLERLGPAPIYVAVHSLEVKRVENRLTTELLFASFRWGK